MPDYELTRLSTRSFEQLVQSLLLQAIGPGVTVFGDGPDGGREATFEGAVPYPTTSEPWNGSGVIQVKFRQLPANPSDNANWIKQEIRKELQSYLDNRRPCPNYFLFVSNVRLSSGKGKGKDQVRSLVRELSREAGAIAADVWDYDEVRSLLDAFDGIRRTYAAWILPSDLLVEALSALSLQSTDFHDAIRLLIQKEFLADEFANLQQAGHLTDEKTPLARVFVDLPVSDQPPSRALYYHDGADQPHIISLMMARSDEQINPNLTPHARAIGRSALEDFQRGRIVIIGGPGQGKTTVGQFIAQIYRASILTSLPQPSLMPQTQVALSDLFSQCQSEQIRQPNARRFPLRVVLNEYAAWINRQKQRMHSDSLLSYLALYIRRRTDIDVKPTDLRKWLSNYPWVLILDGLDEVPASTNRDSLLSNIRDFLVDCAEGGANVCVIATTRPQGYNNDFSPDVYDHFWLAPLNREKALHYASRLIDERYKEDDDRRQKVLQRVRRAADEDATRRLLESPLQITILTALLDQIGQAPRERWRLFKEYYRVIYQREMERDIPSASILRVCPGTSGGFA